ncbi:MAG TPA: 5-deoxy-glucuronate isomerase [Solirubrobacteraceae bacterium]|nr:5-deoxy-glucuronate isomerase [Solirubrobacteraceae bacterium]
MPVTDLLVHPSSPAADGTVLSVSPASAGWEYVGFEVLSLTDGVAAERACGERELCVVVVAGTADVSSEHGEWTGLGGREDPWSGPPEGAYLPPGSHVRLEGAGEVALCWAPAPGGGAQARRLSSDGVTVETRGYGSQQRTVTPILMADREADSLLVCEVLTPGGNWSSYPPHKHDVENPPAETFLEETYYHRVRRPAGFGLQRVYTQDRSLDETLSFGDGDCVLVPRGYHTVSAPPGYDLYYLNVMAGPVRQWAVVNDPDHEWRLAPSSS